MKGNLYMYDFIINFRLWYNFIFLFFHTTSRFYNEVHCTIIRIFVKRYPFYLYLLITVLPFLDYAYRMKESDVSGMKIPAQPISYGDAKHFLRYQESISYMYMYLYMPVVTYEKFVKIVFF